MKKGHSLDVVASLVLFAFFSVSVLLVVMLGARSYQQVVQSIDESYENRTCLQYIVTKVSHYSGTDAVTITQFGDGDALVLQEEFDGELYTTYLYYYDGMLMELFCSAQVELLPSDGFSIVETDGFSIQTLAQNLLEITCTNQGQHTSVLVALQAVPGGGL